MACSTGKPLTLPATMTETPSPTATSTPLPTPTETPTPLPTSTPNVEATKSAQAAASVAAVAATKAAKTRLDQFKTSPPDGEYTQDGVAIAVVAGAVAYRSKWGSASAPSGSKFVTMAVAVGTSSGTFVSSNDFTLVDIEGSTVAPDVCTYEFQTPFPTLSLQAGDGASGGLCFKVPKDFIPSRLVFKGFRETITVVMVAP